MSSDAGILGISSAWASGHTVTPKPCTLQQNSWGLDLRCEYYSLVPGGWFPWTEIVCFAFKSCSRAAAICLASQRFKTRLVPQAPEIWTGSVDVAIHVTDPHVCRHFARREIARCIPAFMRHAVGHVGFLASLTSSFARRGTYVDIESCRTGPGRCIPGWSKYEFALKLGLRIQVYKFYLHWALKYVIITHIGLFGSLGLHLSFKLA